MARIRRSVTRLEELEQPVAELTSAEAAEAPGGIILMPVPGPLELFALEGMTFPTQTDQKDRERHPL